MTQRLLTVEQVAERLALSPRTIRNRIGPRAKVRFPIPSRKIGKAVRFIEADVDRFIQELPGSQC